MKRLVLCVICLCAAVTFAWAVHSYSTIQYDLILGQPGTGSTTTKVYTKGTKSRMETQAFGTQTITIFDGTQAYMYMPSQNVAMVVPMEQTKAQLPEIGDYDTNCENLGEEVVDGRTCTVYNCSKGGQPIKMWIDKSIDFPIKTQTAQMTARFKNIIFDQPLDDSLFVLPEGVNPTDTSGMMPGMQGSTGIPTGNSDQ